MLNPNPFFNYYDKMDYSKNNNVIFQDNIKKKEKNISVCFFEIGLILK